MMPGCPRLHRLSCASLHCVVSQGQAESNCSSPKTLSKPPYFPKQRRRLLTEHTGHDPPGALKLSTQLPTECGDLAELYSRALVRCKGQGVFCESFLFSERQSMNRRLGEHHGDDAWTRRPDDS